MMVYLVNEMTDTEYGYTEVRKIFDSMEKAQQYVDAHQYHIDCWYEEDSLDALTIEEMKVE